MKIRSSSSLSLLLVWSLFPAAVTAEVALRPFNANYDLHRGNSHIGNTELVLERRGNRWRWRSLTKAQGVYAWFTRKQPYTETSFSPADSEFLLNEILISDARKKSNYELASFDWNKSQLEVFRKGKHRQLRLEAKVYDYQSIRLLAAIMVQQRQVERRIDFYRKGKLVKSRMTYMGRQILDLDGKNMDVNVYEQVISKSKSTIKYYYDAANPLLPLRIEKLEPRKKPSVLTLRRIDWGL